MADPLVLSAQDVPVRDVGGNFTANEVEGVLAELAAGGGGASYTTIVTDDASLATALTTNGGDTFIVAGTYTINFDTLGVLDTTPRRFVGAAPQPGSLAPVAGNGVGIELTGTGLLDFSASLTTAEGVQWANVFIAQDSGLVGPGMLVGCFRVTNVHLDGFSLAPTGFSGCRNLSDCTFTNGAAGNAGFSGCTRLTNCTASNTTETGFLSCTDLTNCHVEYQAVIGSSIDAFFACDRVTNCSVDLTALTATSGGTFRAIRFCDEIVNFTVLGPATVVAATVGMEMCERVTNGFVESMALNYTLCLGMTDCESVQGTGVGSGQHFTFCERVKGCHMDGTGDDPGVDGFENCSQVSDCRADSPTGHGFDGGSIFNNCRVVSPAAGFDCFNACFDLSTCRAFGGDVGYQTCEGLTSCRADSAGTDGFNGCTKVSACHAESNSGDGFDACVNMSSCAATLNTGFGYRDCAGITSCTSSANTAGTDTGSTRKDAVTNSF